jgi:hypothetical protein
VSSTDAIITEKKRLGSIADSSPSTSIYAHANVAFPVRTPGKASLIPGGGVRENNANRERDLPKIAAVAIRKTTSPEICRPDRSAANQLFLL